MYLCNYSLKKNLIKVLLLIEIIILKAGVCVPNAHDLCESAQGSWEPQAVPGALSCHRDVNKRGGGGGLVYTSSVCPIKISAARRGNEGSNKTREGKKPRLGKGKNSTALSTENIVVLWFPSIMVVNLNCRPILRSHSSQTLMSWQALYPHTLAHKHTSWRFFLKFSICGVCKLENFPPPLCSLRLTSMDKRRLHAVHHLLLTSAGTRRLQCGLSPISNANGHFNPSEQQQKDSTCSAFRARTFSSSRRVRGERKPLLLCFHAGSITPISMSPSKKTKQWGLMWCLTRLRSSIALSVGSCSLSPTLRLSGSAVMSAGGHQTPLALNALRGGKQISRYLSLETINPPTPVWHWFQTPRPMEKTRQINK